MVLRKIHLERSGNPSFFKGRNCVIREKREILHFVNINFFEWQVYEKILHIENFCRWSVLKTLKLKWGKEIVMRPHDPIYFIFCLYYSFSNTKNNIHLTSIWYFLQVWWWQITFVLKVILDLIIFYFAFHFKECSKWLFLAILENIKKIRKFIYIYQLYVYIN